MLNCVYGQTGSGKTEYVYRKIRDNMEKGKRSFILVPEQASMDTEREMIERLGLSAQLKVEVLTFSRLCNLVFSEVGPLRLKYIDKAGKLFVVRKTMQNIEKKLEFYHKNVHQRGFAQMVSDLISELKRYGVEPEIIRAAAKKNGGTDFSKKLNDIALIYEEYDRLIGEKYSDAEENLIKAVPGISKSGLFKGEIFLMNFKSFTPINYMAISELMKISDVTAVLCMDSLTDKEGIFASAVSTWEKLKSEADKVGCNMGESVFLADEYKCKDSKALVHLKNNYFKYPDNIYNEETSEISLVVARDNYDEVKKCAEIISKLCRKENYKHKDFLVLARNPESYYAAIKAVFREQKINCFLNENRSLATNAFIRKILSVAEILAYGFSYERIMPVVRFGGEQYTRSEADIFENYVLASNINHKYWNQTEDWEYDPDPDRINLETVNKVKRNTVNSIIALRESIKGNENGRKTVSEICRAFLKWIEDEQLGKIMGDRVNELNAKGKITTALEYTRAWSAFSSVITQLKECMGEDYITYEKLYEMLRDAFGEIKLSVAPSLSDQVTFDSVDTFRKADAKVVFVLGLTDGVFPKGYIEDGMLSDAEREMLSEYDIELAPTADFKRREEQNLIYNVLTAPSEKLYLSVPLGDKEGKAKIRSEIVDRTLTIFPDMTVIETEDSVSESSEVIFKTLLTAIIKNEGELSGLSAQDKAIYEFFINDEILGEELKRFIDSVKKYSPEEKLTGEIAKKLYGKKLLLSVSRLEKYNACAFAYFMHYGLYAKERLKAGFEANNIGSALHETLERYLSGLKERNANYSGITYSECKGEISEIAQSIARKSDELLYETSPYYRYVSLRMESVATATAWEIVKFYANSCFRPYGFEVKIGGDGPFDGMNFNIGDCEAEVRGFIDRIDMAEIDGERFINIVDYKSSVKSTNEHLEDIGVQIQPLVYASIARDNLKATPSGMMYIHMNEPILGFESEPDDETLEKERRKKIEVKGVVLNDGDIIKNMDSREETGAGYLPHGKTSVLSRNEMTARIARAEEKVKETAGKIISGDIKINPQNDKDFSACRYCEFYKICGKDKMKI